MAVEQSGAQPVLVVNKIDLPGEERRHELLARLQPYRSLGMPVLPCSAERGEGIEDLRAALTGHTCVFVGQSGVGKSSLLNALDGEVEAPTGAVRDGDGRGRHTTTFSALYELPGDIRVIDTPGVRRFSPEDADRRTSRGLRRVRAARGRLPLPRLLARARARLRRPPRRRRRRGLAQPLRELLKLLGGDGDPRAADEVAAPRTTDGSGDCDSSVRTPYARGGLRACARRPPASRTTSSRPGA